MKIFVSHPFSGDPFENRILVDEICKLLSLEGHLPISPLHLFSFMPDDTYRREIMSICKTLMWLADECWFYEYGKLSEGQKEELDFAQEKGFKCVIKD